MVTTELGHIGVSHKSSNTHSSHSNYPSSNRGNNKPKNRSSSNSN